MGRRQPEGYEGTHGREKKKERKGKQSRKGEKKPEREENLLLIRVEREERMTANKASE